MPSALAITRSSGVVMKPRTRFAFAPVYTVTTLTTAMSLFGNCRTLSERIDWMPAIRITRLTTIARTGRLMKRSVSFMCRSSRLRSAVFRLRRRAVAGLDLVVDQDRRAVAQLEDARRHHLGTGREARHDRDLVAAADAQLHELLRDTAVLLPLRARQLLHDEDGVAVL